MVQVEYPQDWLATPLEQTGQKQAAWRTDPAQTGAGGAIGDIGTHAFNLAGFITGLELEELCAELLAMLKALVEGTSSPAQMADLARGVLRRKFEPLALALEGRFGEHRRYLLALHLRRLEAMQAELADLDGRIEERMQAFRHQRDQLMQIPGIDRSVASSIVAEIGVDMTVFGTAKRLAAWAGVYPGNHESAGRQKETAIRKGNVRLKTTLVNAAMSAIKQKGSYYKAKYYRLKVRRGVG